MPLKRPFVPKSDVKQRFTTTTTCLSVSRISYRVIICFICRMKLLPEVFLLAIKEQSIKAYFTFLSQKLSYKFLSGWKNSSATDWLYIYQIYK